MVIGRAERRRRGLPEIDLPIAAQFPDQGRWHGVARFRCTQTRSRAANQHRALQLRRSRVGVIACGRASRSRTPGRPDVYGSLPPRSRDEGANSSTARHFASFIEEFLDGSASMQQASLLTDLGGKPLIVLTADRNADDGCSRSRTTWPPCRPTVSIVPLTQPTHRFWRTKRTPL
jgi:hypothetical protein